jgi:serine/threonine protein phosphatase PrpC
MWKMAKGSDPVVRKASVSDGALLDCHGDSIIGRRRALNQDRFVTESFKRETLPEAHDPIYGARLAILASRTGHLLGVADGIGGAPAGERASLLVVETLKAFIQKESSSLLQAGRPDDQIVETLGRGVRTCQAALASEVRRHPEVRGMGTTLTAAVVLWPRLYLFHMGDSRAYLLREGLLRRLTRDQTYARALVEAGVLEPKGEDRSRWKHVVWNTLGGRASAEDPEVRPEVHIEDLRGGDALLLCTDGLTDALTDETIHGLLLKGGSAEALSRGLIDSARERGARDDATVVVARFADGVGDGE